MGVKIKANDDRVQAVAVAVLLIVRGRLANGQASGGLITTALAEFRGDYAGYKADHPKRDLTEAKEARALTGARKEDYLKLVAAVEGLLAKIERNSTQFSSVLAACRTWDFHVKQAPG